MDNDKYIGKWLDNRYEIQEVIGVGGMAVVYKAKCNRLNRAVAIKILKDEYSKDEEFRRRFHAEGQAVAMLSHPNIVSVYDVSTSEEADYIVMELIDGISLKQYMEKKGVLNWKETLHFAMQISKALEHAHSRGIVHRDIKPHNIMVLKNGSVKVADFGIARVMSKSNTLTKEALGSVHYISPEQAKGGRVDDRSDIYSLGVVMYEMMTGRPPYDGESPVAVAIQHINGGAKMPSTLNPNIPGGLEQIIMKAMAHEPAARYASATAMLADMDEFRKLPTMLFDYNSPPVEAVTQIVRGIPKEEKPQTGAQRAVAAGTGNGVRRRTPGERKQTPQRRSAPPAKKRRDDYDEDDDRSKAATIAIIACSAVAVIAIVIFLVVLLGGGVGGPQEVKVPNLVGKNYDTLPAYNNFTVTAVEYAYDGTFEKGRIISQDPARDTMAKTGSEIKVVVSLGAAPSVRTMEDLVGQTPQVAQNFLDKQGIAYLCKDENSDTVETGKICRTEPEAGTVLQDGQTVILYISQGASIKKVDMPDLVGKDLHTAQTIMDNQGMYLNVDYIEESNEDIPMNEVLRTEPAVGTEIKTGDKIYVYYSSGPATAIMPDLLGKTREYAEGQLEALGFNNVKFEEVESEKPVGQVLEQSEEHGASQEDAIPVDTYIVIKVAVASSVQAVKITHNFQIPAEITSDFVIEIYDEEMGRVYSNSFPAGTTSVPVDVEGIGTMEFTLIITDAADEHTFTEKVTFN